MKIGDLYWIENVGICKVKDVHLKDVSFNIVTPDNTIDAQKFFYKHLKGFSMAYNVINYDIAHGAAKKLNGIERAILRVNSKFLSKPE